MVALFAGYLEDPPRYDPYPKSYAAAAARLGWKRTTLVKRIEYLRELTAGSTLYLPVFVKGALLWASDAHAAQGNGEINLTGIETAFNFMIPRIDSHHSTRRGSIRNTRSPRRTPPRPTS